MDKKSNANNKLNELSLLVKLIVIPKTMMKCN